MKINQPLNPWPVWTKGNPINSKTEYDFLCGFFNTLHTNHLILHGQSLTHFKEVEYMPYTPLMDSAEAVRDGFSKTYEPYRVVGLSYHTLSVENPQDQGQLKRRLNMLYIRSIAIEDQYGNRTAPPEDYDPQFPDNLPQCVQRSLALNKVSKSKRIVQVHEGFNSNDTTLQKSIPRPPPPRMHDGQESDQDPSTQSTLVPTLAENTESPKPLPDARKSTKKRRLRAISSSSEESSPVKTPAPSSRKQADASIAAHSPSKPILRPAGNSVNTPAAGL